ncbi:MAG TPA: nuclear transport factor 2 family protein [Thermoleophilaceae bacterium]
MAIGVLLYVVLTGDDSKEPDRASQVRTPRKSPAATPDRADEPAQPAEADVRQLLSSYARLYRAEDAAGLGELFAADAVRSNEGDPPESREQAIATYRRQFARLTNADYELSGVQIESEPGAATVRARYTIASDQGTVTGRIAYHLVPGKRDDLLIKRLDIAPNAPDPTESATTALTSFRTPRDPDEEFSAAYCRLKGGVNAVLYCWTPNDGYTLELREGAGYSRVPDDDLNRGRAPGGGATLDFGARAKLAPFTCTSSVSALSCVDGDGRGFRLPRYRGLPRPLG